MTNDDDSGKDWVRFLVLLAAALTAVWTSALIAMLIVLAVVLHVRGIGP